jgi:hypothetical protein
MKLTQRPTVLAILLAASLLISPHALAAKKLKGFYGGSGGITPDVHRNVLIQFGSDGTAIVDQNWTGRPPQEWHTHWTQDGDKVSITFDLDKEGKRLKPLLLDFKNGALTATDWDADALGLGGPPKLTPFGGKNPQPGTATSCVSMNARDPSSQNCQTWSSRQ